VDLLGVKSALANQFAYGRDDVDAAVENIEKDVRILAFLGRRTPAGEAMSTTRRASRT
jgi:hypothetical protein